MNLNAAQLQTLRHMLGIDRPELDVPKPTRDYYCANPDDPHLVEMEKLGAVEKYSERGGYHWFKCTPAGRAAGIASHRTIRYGRAQRRYIKFLDVKDCCPDLTFRQFLTDERFRESRTVT